MVSLTVTPLLIESSRKRIIQPQNTIRQDKSFVYPLNPKLERPQYTKLSPTKFNSTGFIDFINPNLSISHTQPSQESQQTTLKLPQSCERAIFREKIDNSYSPYKQFRTKQLLSSIIRGMNAPQHKNIRKHAFTALLEVLPQVQRTCVEDLSLLKSMAEINNNNTSQSFDSSNLFLRIQGGKSNQPASDFMGKNESPFKRVSSFSQHIPVLHPTQTEDTCSQRIVEQEKQWRKEARKCIIMKQLKDYNLNLEQDIEINSEHLLKKKVEMTIEDYSEFEEHMDGLLPRRYQEDVTQLSQQQSRIIRSPTTASQIYCFTPSLELQVPQKCQISDQFKNYIDKQARFKRTFSLSGEDSSVLEQNEKIPDIFENALINQYKGAIEQRELKENKETRRGEIFEPQVVQLKCVQMRKTFGINQQELSPNKRSYSSNQGSFSDCVKTQTERVNSEQTRIHWDHFPQSSVSCPLNFRKLRRRIVNRSITFYSNQKNIANL